MSEVSVAVPTLPNNSLRDSLLDPNATEKSKKRCPSSVSKQETKKPIKPSAMPRWSGHSTIVPTKERIPMGYARKKGLPIRSHVPQRYPSDRELKGTLVSLTTKASAEVAKGESLSTVTCRESQKRVPSTTRGTVIAGNNAASPKNGAPTKRAVPEGYDLTPWKKVRRECSVAECTNWRVKGGVCCRHGARKTRKCEGSTKYAHNGGVCIRHELNELWTSRFKSGAIANEPTANGVGLQMICSVAGGTNEGQNPTMYASDDDDEVGALIYKSSLTAKARAEGKKVKSCASVHHDPHNGLACNQPPDSILHGSALPNRTDVDDQNGALPKSLGVLVAFAEEKKAASPVAFAEAKKAASSPPMIHNDESLANTLRHLNPKPNWKPKPKVKKVSSRPLNRYNIYFIFERENIIQSKGGSTNRSVMMDTEESHPTKQGCESLNIPPLPPRFAHFKIPDGWHIPRQKKNRRIHRKSHGVATFQELAKSIAKSWKNIDSETLEWTMQVEKILMQRRVELAKKARTDDGVQSKSPDAQIAKQAAQTQVVAPMMGGQVRVGLWSTKQMINDWRLYSDLDMAERSVLSNDTDLAGKNATSLKNCARDNHSAHSTPYAASITHNQIMLSTEHKYPSRATSKKAGHLNIKGHAMRNKNGKEEETSNDKHVVGMQIEPAVSSIDSTIRSVSNEEYQANKELQALVVNYHSASRASQSYMAATGQVNAPAASKESMSTSSAAAPLDSNANMSTKVLMNTDAVPNNAVEGLKKYLNMIECAQVLQARVTEKIQQRILPHISVSPKSTSSVGLQQHQAYSCGNLPIQATTGSGMFNPPHRNNASTAQRMLEVERITRILKTEQARRMIREALSGGPPITASRGEGEGEEFAE